MANSIFLSNGLSSDAGGNSTTPGTITAGGAGGSFYAADGTALLPAYSFTSEPTLGFWRSGAASITLQGSLTSTGSLNSGNNVQAGAAGYVLFTGRANVSSPANGVLTLQNAATTLGSQLKVDALPTASGFFTGGTAPAVTAGSTPLAGSVNVGTGTPAAVGTITFGGTNFPSPPFPIVMNQTTGAICRATATVSALTITGLANFVANDVISWVCISSK